MASFGFSIGDIILVSQLSYQLYRTLTSGRQKANRDLQELQHVLFSLHCALDHLRHVAGEVSGKADMGTSVEVEEREMQQDLCVMIRNCATTLEDLDVATKKYRDGVREVEGDVDCTEVENAQRWRSRIKRRLVSDWARIRWDLDKDDMKRYREKLQMHTDSITLVLNTCVWGVPSNWLAPSRSTTKKIQADGKLNTVQMQDFAAKVLMDNASLKGTVDNIHIMLCRREEAMSDDTSTHLPWKRHRFELEQRESATESFGLMLAAAHYSDAPRMLVNMEDEDMTERAMFSSQPSRPVNLSFRSLHSRVQPGYEHSQDATARPQVRLPESIVQLNTKRRIQGLQSLEAYKQRMTSNSQPPLPIPKAVTEVNLMEGLGIIFTPFPRSSPRQLDMAKQARAQDARSWMQSFEQMLNTLARAQVRPDKDGSQAAIQAQQNQLVSVLTKMNEMIENSNKSVLEVFYGSVLAAKFEDVLHSPTNVTKSVRVQKEIDEFMDEFEAWTEEH